MSNQIGNNLTYLKLLEASQSAFESSEKALKAAEEALTAAKIVHVEAKAALDTATEAFKASSYTLGSEKISTPLIPEHTPFLLITSRGTARLVSYEILCQIYGKKISVGKVLVCMHHGSQKRC